jgi:hypothetical protein
VAEVAWNYIPTEGRIMRGEARPGKNNLRPLNYLECQVYDYKKNRKAIMHAK